MERGKFTICSAAIFKMPKAGARSLKRGLSYAKYTEKYSKVLVLLLHFSYI